MPRARDQALIGEGASKEFVGFGDFPDTFVDDGPRKFISDKQVVDQLGTTITSTPADWSRGRAEASLHAFFRSLQIEQYEQHDLAAAMVFERSRFTRVGAVGKIRRHQPRLIFDHRREFRARSPPDNARRKLIKSQRSSSLKLWLKPGIAVSLTP